MEASLFRRDNSSAKAWNMKQIVSEIKTGTEREEKSQLERDVNAKILKEEERAQDRDEDTRTHGDRHRDNEGEGKERSKLS